MRERAGNPYPIPPFPIFFKMHESNSVCSSSSSSMLMISVHFDSLISEPRKYDEKLPINICKVEEEVNLIAL